MFEKRKTPSSSLRIIIVGGGKVGRTLVERLSQEGHDITIIDRKSDRIQQITGLYDVMGIEGNGASYEILQEAGIAGADVFIAVTDSDELNLLCCTIATQESQCAAIARVRSPEYGNEIHFLQDRLGLSLIINPELEAAQEMARILYLPASLEVNSFSHGRAEIVKFRIPEQSPLDGCRIYEMGQKYHLNVLIIAIERNGEVIIPSGSAELMQGDLIYLVATAPVAREFFSRIGQSTRQIRSVLIIGGGRAAYYLSKQLLENNIKVKIIESNAERCRILSMLLPDAVIINGDGTDEDLLVEEGISHVDGFVPLTGIDEENIVLTLYAKQASSAKVITKINRIGFYEVIEELDLGSVVYPKHIASEAIIAFVRAKKNSKNHSNIETLYHLFDRKVEAIEFTVSEESAVTAAPLRDLKLKNNVLLSSISSGSDFRIPSGNDRIKVGDTVQIVTTHKGFTDILEILR